MTAWPFQSLEIPLNVIGTITRISKWHHKPAPSTATTSSSQYISSPTYKTSTDNLKARRLLPLPPRNAHPKTRNRPIHPPRFPNSRLHLPNQPLHPPLHRLKNLQHIRQLLLAPPTRERSPRLDNPRIKPRLRLARPRKSHRTYKQRRCGCLKGTGS